MDKKTKVTKKYFCHLASREVILTEITVTIPDGNSIYPKGVRTYTDTCEGLKFCKYGCKCDKL